MIALVVIVVVMVILVAVTVVFVKNTKIANKTKAVGKEYNKQQRRENKNLSAKALDAQIGDLNEMNEFDDDELDDFYEGNNSGASGTGETGTGETGTGETGKKDFNTPLDVGEYVKYPIDYKDAYTDFNFDTIVSWRIITPGTFKDGRYYGTEIIPTGTMMNIPYNYEKVQRYDWVLPGPNASDRILHGLKDRFLDIPLIEYKDHNNDEENKGIGYYKNIIVNGQKLTGKIRMKDIFNSEKLKYFDGVRMITLEDVNKVLGRDLSSTDAVKEETSKAVGLIKLNNLNNFGYSSCYSYYWLATKYAEGVNSLYTLQMDGSISYSNASTNYIRPIVKLPDGIRIDKRTGNLSK